ncbi:MAG: hypothetical protein WCT12_25470 [Verrucomicrobiota bacterium]
MNAQNAFSIVAVFYSVANLGSMGLEINLRETIKSLRSVRVIRKARADMSLAAAIMPLAVVSTVVLMPLMAPLLIPGLTLSSWAIGKPLLLTVLLPLVVWLALSSFLGSRAGKTSAGSPAGLPVQCAK